MIKYLKHIVFFFCVVTTSLGCKKNSRDFYYSSFPANISLTGKSVDTDSVMFRYPFRIKHQDSLAIVMDLHHPDYFYHLFSYPQFKYVSSFGKRGQAPEENLSIENFRLTKGKMWGLDANKNVIEITPLRDIHNQSSVVSVSLNKVIIRALDFALYDNSCFIIPDYSGEHRYHIIDKNGNVQSSHGEIPTIEHKKRNMALAQAWRSFIDYNSSNGILALATQLGEVLEVYNLKEGTHIVKFGPRGEPEFNQADGMAIPSGVMGFSDIQVTNKYIYAVFHGRSFKEIAKQQPLIDGGQYIYVFSLKGEPLVKYTLDRFIYGIDVNEITNELYAVDVNSNSPIVKYKLKHL